MPTNRHSGVFPKLIWVTKDVDACMTWYEKYFLPIRSKPSLALRTNFTSKEKYACI